MAHGAEGKGQRAWSKEHGAERRGQSAEQKTKKLDQASHKASAYVKTSAFAKAMAGQVGGTSRPASRIDRIKLRKANHLTDNLSSTGKGATTKAESKKSIFSRRLTQTHTDYCADDMSPQ